MDRRRLTFWFIRWADLNWPNHDSMERIKRKAEKYAWANITTAVIYGCHFRWDYMPYFTILHDYLAAVSSELAKYGIELMDHHSVNLVHRYDTPEQMRHVMRHSNVHIPFSPSREMAAAWEYQGKKLNSWRMTDVRTGNPLYLPQYAAESFCHRNPQFMEAYQDYAVKLVQDTGIKGLMADDTTYFMGYLACGCRYCRQALKEQTGIELPSIEDQSFWGNWENPAWKAWIDLRFDAAARFHKALQEKLPRDFTLMSCCSGSASVAALEAGTDARKFLEGTNYMNLEMVGNVPPYKEDPYTVNNPLGNKLISASHHQAAAKEKKVRCYGIGFGFTEATANIIWAVNKVLDSDCHFSTLKPRLGLPDSILEQLPEEEDMIGRAYKFEAEHPELFDAEQFGQVGVYFSYETRNHTCFGNLVNGYSQDYSNTLKALFRAGISAHTLFCLPQDADQYPFVIIPSPASMTAQEIAEVERYVANGGRVAITGPSAYPGCEDHWVLPTHPQVQSQDFFKSSDGIRLFEAPWVRDMKLSPCKEPDEWNEVGERIYYNPHRVSDGRITTSLLELCRTYGRKPPVMVEQAKGYFITIFTGEQGTIVHLLAEDYHTDIDHHLDEIRFHRSRVNFINKVEPIGVSREIQLDAAQAPLVYTPFNDEPSKVDMSENGCTVTLPEACSYVILWFRK